MEPEPAENPGALKAVHMTGSDLSQTASGAQTPTGLQTPKHGHNRSDSFTSVATVHSFKQPWEGRTDARLAKRKSSMKGGKAAEAQVAAALSEDEARRCSDRMVNQFLRATNGNVDQSIKRLKDTLAWRKQQDADSVFCQGCVSQRNAHYLQVVGHDEYGRPIFYSCFALAVAKGNVESNRIHMIATFEQAIRSMPPHVEQWVWVCDFHGFAMSDCDPRLARNFLDVSARHYPERLARFYIIAAPAIFSILWRGIKGMVDPATAQKISFLPYDWDKKGEKGALAKALSDDHSHEMKAWLLTEMQQNRVKKLAKQKAYPYGREFQSPKDMEAVQIEGHDIRGFPDWISLVSSQPGILVPPGAA